MTEQAENTIEWTSDKLESFKAYYDEAVRTADDPVNDVFYFEDNIFVIAYAKYLIQYLETVFS